MDEGSRRSETVPDYRTDRTYTEDQIVVELKSVQNMAEGHEVLLVNYLNGLKKIGL